MSDDRDILRTLTSQQCCPWLMIFRTFGISLSAQLLLLGAVGAVLTSVAWQTSAAVFGFWDTKESASDTEVASPEDVAFQPVAERLQRWPGARRAVGDPGRGGFVSSAGRVISGSQRDPFHEIWDRIGNPFVRLFDIDLSLRQFCFLLCGGLLTILVWAFFGGAIARTAAVRLAREQRVGLGESLEFALKKTFSIFSAPVLSLVAVFCIAVPTYLAGLLLGGWDVGVVVLGIFWGLVIVASFLSALLLLGLLFGWPLMWATIATEGTDHFDALSRSYSYPFQRPLQYLFYAVVAGLLGSLGWLLVSVFAEAVIALGYWAASWGIGMERIIEIRAIAAGDETEATGALNTGGWLIGFWNGCVRTVATAFTYSFFFTVAAAIYLLLRKDVDQTEIDEVFLEDEADSYGLPDLSKDEAGVAGVPEDESAGAEEEADDSDQK